MGINLWLLTCMGWVVIVLHLPVSLSDVGISRSPGEIGNKNSLGYQWESLQKGVWLNTTSGLPLAASGWLAPSLAQSVYISLCGHGL